MALIDLSVNEAVLERTVQLARERNIIIPTLEQQNHPERIPAGVVAGLEERRPLGPQPPQPLPHHLAQRADGQRRRLRWRQLYRIPEFSDRRAGPHPGSRRQVVPDRRPQGRRRLRLPGAAAGHRAVRPHPAEGGLALHRQLLPRRRLRLQPARLRVDRHPARGDEPGALRVARHRSPARSIKTPGSESNVKEIFDKCWELRTLGRGS